MILSAGIVVLRHEHERCLVLLLRVYRYWDFPKGEVEAGEDPLQAAIREVAEETGITQLEFPWGQVYRETPPYNSGTRRKIARYYLATTHSKHVTLPVNPALGKAEHDEYRWVDFKQAEALLTPRLVAILHWAATTSQCR